MDGEGNRHRHSLLPEQVNMLAWRAPALGWTLIAFPAGIPIDVPLMAPV